MIIGVFLRNFKAYKSITYIPLSNGEGFCGLIGRNGIGKSSILEALDFFWGHRDFCENNEVTLKDDRYVMPVFLIKKSQLSNANISTLAEKYSNSIWNLLKSNEHGTINSNYWPVLSEIQGHIKMLSGYSQNDDYILPIGLEKNRTFTLGIFRDPQVIDETCGLSENEKTMNIDELTQLVYPKFNNLLNYVLDSYNYVYIPKDIEPERLVRFETMELQTLIGENLHEKVSSLLPKTTISTISKNLKDFVDALSSSLSGYKFKTPNTRQPNLKPDKIYSLIIQDFFSLRELHKEGRNGGDLSLKELSTGEKQQALIDLVYGILSKYRKKENSNLIIAVDEPDSSLHISACYDQFEKLFYSSNHCNQVFFSTHWYGFIPAIPEGSITNIFFEKNKHKGLIFNIYKYREEISIQNKEYRKQQQKPLPVDIQLKSTNDFVQSIVMSVTSGQNYNWLLCEGSSDKVYLEAYFRDEINNKKLRIVPVCTAKEIKKIYSSLSNSLQDLRTEISGKIFMLTDTDNNLVEFETEKGLESFLICRRLLNNEKTKQTDLVNIKDGNKGPRTDIEDVLNGKLFKKALVFFKDKYPNELSFVDDVDVPEIASGFALDLKRSEYESLDVFFNANNGKNKVFFAQKYVELMAEGSYVIPSWVIAIKQFFFTVVGNSKQNHNNLK